jgi:CelD/BcsL family acetyltransferase involved in cellulose biosynthesis
MPHWSVHTVSLHEQPALWERLHADSPDSNVFSSAKWLSVMAEVFHRHALGFVLESDGTPMAGIPLLLRRRGPLRVATPLPISLYAGLIRCAASPLPLDQLLSVIEHEFHFISLSAVFSGEERNMLAMRGWRLRKQQSIRISLNDMQSVWEGFSQSLRRKLRRASEGQLRLDTDPPLDLVVRMFEQSYLRHGTLPPIPGTTLERWLRALTECGITNCFAARHPDGRYAAVRVVIRNGNVLYDWLAGVDPSVAPSAAHWLVHALLARYAAEGCMLFDFMGANTPGVTDFKRSFGGYDHEYHEAEWYRPSVLRHLNALRNKRQRLRRGFR